MKKLLFSQLFSKDICFRFKFPAADQFGGNHLNGKGSLCLRDTAKTLQMQEKRLIQFLHEHRWIYRRPLGSGWLAYSDKLQSGLMEHKVTTGEKSDGTEWANTQARVTAKGLTKLSQLLGDFWEAA